MGASNKLPVSTSSSWAFGTPPLSASVIASASDSMTAMIMKFPHSFTRLAAEGLLPTMKVRWPMAPNRGSAMPMSAGSPAATMNNRRAAAASGRPKTGAHRNR